MVAQPVAYSIREDAKANTFSATPLDASVAIQSLQPSPQSHHAQVFIAQQNAVAFPINGMCVNKELRDKQMTGTGSNGDPMFTVRADGTQHAVAFTAGNLARGAGASPNADVSQTLQSQHDRGSTNQHPCVAHQIVHCIDMCGNKGLNGGGILEQLSQPLGTKEAHAVAHAMTVRRLTPRECERLQGFPDDYTAISWRGKAETPDGPRYKALGNSMAVNCMEWIGERIAAQEVAQ